MSMPVTWPLLGAVAAGGALGAMGRFIMGSAILALLGPRFPWGTLGVNVLGSFVMGLLAGLAARHWGEAGSAELRAFLMVGVLGGFTTFSAFSLDAVILMDRGAYAAMAAYVAGSVVLSVLALLAGLVLARSL